MKKVVMYGAGKIGRGFIGKMFSQSGYDVCFVDIKVDVVHKLNEDQCYPIRVVTNDSQHEEVIEHVRAVNGMDHEDVSQVIAMADVMATAVGVNELPNIIKPICKGLVNRIEMNNRPLDIIICENLLDADIYLRKLIKEAMDECHHKWLDENLGLVQASIGIAVPAPTEAMREGNILRLWVEPYEELPVNKDAFKGEVPILKNLVLFSPFGFYIKRKLFIHNMGHALCAYLGWQKGYACMDVCIADDEICERVESAMKESAMALKTQYGVEVPNMEHYIGDLIKRFGNHELGDTVVRVGKDPIRKLGNQDRLVGAANYCISQGVAPNNIINGIIAGLKYDNKEDESAVRIQETLKGFGIESTLEKICGLDCGADLYEEIIRRFESDH